MAPTQVLAEQHYETISKMVSGLTLAQPGAKETDAAADVEGAMGASGASTVSSSKVTAEIPVTLLTGGMKLAARRKALAAAASGEPGIIVATHAAFSKTFQAPHLALVVIDEQHRFGVEQRESLNAKTDDGTTPHLLVMTATPIPRTAAMTWFGDLDISWLTELPGGRKPIRTVVVNEADAATMGRMFAHIRARVDAGERTYIVCPRIDADDEENEGGSGVSAAAGSASDAPQHLVPVPAQLRAAVRRARRPMPSASTTPTKPSTKMAKPWLARHCMRWPKSRPVAETSTVPRHSVCDSDRPRQG